MKREDELVEAGWERRLIACEPRLSEVVELYSEIGLEVHLEPLPSEEEHEADSLSCEQKGCTACFDVDPERYRIIYTRPSNKT